MSDKIKSILTRYFFGTLGLAFVAAGVAFSIKSDLGTAPISCPPYVLSLKGWLSVGEFTALMHFLFILFQVVLLRKNFKWKYLMQIPAAIVFGFLTDTFILAFDFIAATTYFERVVCLLVSLILTATGVSLEVRSKAWMVAGEMTVAALAEVTGKKFSTVKIFFDIALVAIAATISYLLFAHLLGDGHYNVIREGTIASAVFTGLLMKVTDKFIDRFIGRKLIDRYE